MKTIRIVSIALLIVGTLVAFWGAGYYTGRVDERAFILLNQENAKQAEYTRVVAAIARTMRCSTEEEFSNGRDHQCDPSEITQDAGLTDVDGNQIASR